jgi:hypothetical protein
MKWLHTLKRVFSDKGLLCTAILSFLAVCYWFGPILLHPSIYYMGLGGDGMQTYFQTLYHIQYDQDYWFQHSINYPHGESVFFTSTIPLIANFAKLFGTSAGPFAIALINLFMILSPVAGALFLYAIFRHLRLPWLYGSICATGIAFLSPQIYRMSGHYSLAWVFIIPAMIYLLLRFYDYPSLRKSIVISLLVFIACCTHLYYFVFFGMMSVAYWSVLFLTKDRGFGRISFALKHCTIQLITPFVLMQLLVYFSNPVNDRTTMPGGYLTYVSNGSGIFYPFGMPYEWLVDKIADPLQVEFEGVVYVGLAAMLGLAAIIIVQLYRIFKKRFRLITSVTDHKVLNIFFFVSLFMLWLSFGYPFIHGRQHWLFHLGPFGQFRAAGRFAWLFFYVTNIIAVYRLYKLTIHRKKIIRYSILLIVPGFLLLDGYSVMEHSMRKNHFTNRIQELEDEQNNLVENQWLNKIDSKKYQAILPLPFFHIGSENITLVPHDEKIVLESYIVSLKTGLPIMAVSASRTSVSQSVDLISLLLDPTQKAGVLKNITDKRPLLLLVREEKMDENEKRILSLADIIAESKEYKVYSLAPAKLEALQSIRYAEIKNKLPLNTNASYNCSDSTASFIYHSFDQQKSASFDGNGAFKFDGFIYTDILDTIVRQGGKHTLSFWLNHVDKDLYPRLDIEVKAMNALDSNQLTYIWESVFFKTKAIQNGWGLVEFPVDIPGNDAHIRIKMGNHYLRPGTITEIDELMLYPAGTEMYKKQGDTIYYNNRRYFPQQ